MYLEKFVRYEDDAEEDLYPVPATRLTFTKPYLTPDKHFSYMSFWGGCTLIGFYSMFRIMFRFWIDF